MLEVTKKKMRDAMDKYRTIGNSLVKKTRELETMGKKVEKLGEFWSAYCEGGHTMGRMLGRHRIPCDPWNHLVICIRQAEIGIIWKYFIEKGLECSGSKTRSYLQLFPKLLYCLVAFAKCILIEKKYCII